MIGEVEDSDYEGLMTLYMQLHDNPFPKDQIVGMDLRRKILADERHHIIVAEEDGRIVSPCVCAVILDLTHTQQPYALIESVIADNDYRKEGLATVCLRYAKEIAVNENYYKIMLFTGTKMGNTLDFYEQVGYNRNDKTAFIQWL